MKKKGLVSLFMNPHYRMEKFAIMVMAFVLVLVSIYSICMKRQHDSNKLTLGAQSLYTVQSTFSLTGETVDITGVYRDSGFTKYFVLMKANDMKNLPSDAEGYQMFMTNHSSGKKLTCNPQGAIYVFGNTGYIGLYFHDNGGFESNMYDITVRNWKMQVEGDVALAQSLYADSSFWSYNQINLYANFAGTAAPVAEFLQADTFNAEDVYTELVLEGTSDGVRARLNEELFTMNQSMNVINVYKDRLESYGIVVPELPVSIAGDTIVSNPKLTESNPSAFEASMLTNKSNVNDDYDITVDVEDEQYAVNNKLYLVTDYVFPGGVQYNYQDIKIADHILDKLKPAELTYNQWVQSKQIESNTYSTTNQGFSWKYKDGRVFRSDENAKSEAIQTDISIYESAVNMMVNTKRSYQTSDLYEMLRVDDRNRGISDLFTVVARPETLILY